MASAAPKVVITGTGRAGTTLLVQVLTDLGRDAGCSADHSVDERALDVAVASRVRNTKYGSNLHTFGGLFGTPRATKQREALALLFYELLYTVTRYDLLHTPLVFPRFTDDGEYTGIARPVRVARRARRGDLGSSSEEPPTP